MKFINVNFSVVVRQGTETLTDWKTRFEKITGNQPDRQAWQMSGFPHVKLPKCTTLEKYRWCFSQFGMYGFFEYIEHGGPNEKLWIFNSEDDAAIFKLAWAGVDEPINY
jgi:hypothetical protein